MRELKDHHIQGVPPHDQVRVEADDQAGHGGAAHLYWIRGFSTDSNPAAPRDENDQKIFQCALPPVLRFALPIVFQHGYIRENGLNGVTNEALLTIVMDRLRGFQKGPFACQQNANALEFLDAAMFCLKNRTLDRIARGVEGTDADVRKAREEAPGADSAVDTSRSGDCCAIKDGKLQEFEWSTDLDAAPRDRTRIWLELQITPSATSVHDGYWGKLNPSDEEGWLIAPHPDAPVEVPRHPVVRWAPMDENFRNLVFPSFSPKQPAPAAPTDDA